MSRKNVLRIGLASILFIALAAGAQQSQQDQQKATEAYMKMMETNENHAYLKIFAGEWSVSTKAWMQPGAPSESSEGSLKGEVILGGRFLKMEFKGTMFGQAFEGLQIAGYDNMKKKCITFWIDNTSTAFYLTEGTREAAGKVTIDTGLWPDPMTGGTINVRGLTTLVGPDEFTYEMYMIGPDGKEFKSLEYRAARKK